MDGGVVFYRSKLVVSDRQGRGAGPFVHAAVSVEFQQRDRAERRGDRLEVQVADRPGDRLGWPVVVDVGSADVRGELPWFGSGLGELVRSERSGDSVVQGQPQLV